MIHALYYAYIFANHIAYVLYYGKTYFEKQTIQLEFERLLQQVSQEREKVSLAMPDHDVSRVLGDIADVIASRKGADPASSYVAKLFSRAPDGILKKVGEEAAECIMAAKDASPKDIIYETADLWFHTMVMLAHFNLRPEQVIAELERREGMSGIAEKLSRSK